MKKIQFSRNSWHFRLAATYGNFKHNYANVDLCSYVRQVLLGMIVVIAIMAVGGLIACCIGDLLAWIAAFITTKQLLMIDTPGLIIAVISGSVLIAVAFEWIKNRCHDWSMKRRYARFEREKLELEKLETADPSEPPEPGFFARVYQSIKEKTCFLIELT